MSTGTVKRVLLGAIALALIGMYVQASPALAAQPWWKLQVDTAPAVLRQGQARDEVQEVTIRAISGVFKVTSDTASGPLEHKFAWNATHQEVQQGFEEMFGHGNVEVPSGQGSETGSEPYKIIWKGAFSDRTITPLRVERHLILPDGTEENSENLQMNGREVVAGRSDATVVLTAGNLGDADLVGPVRFVVKLPSGLTALRISGGGGLRGQSPLECSKETLVCTYTGATVPYGQVQLVIPVNLNPGAKSGEMVELQASGGNALPAKVVRAITVVM